MFIAALFSLIYIFIFIFILFIYLFLFLAALGLSCGMQALPCGVQPSL